MTCSNKYCCTKIKNLSVCKNGTDILSNIHLHIHCGAITAIIGPNGAGKSTLLKALIGEEKYRGTLDFIDENESKHNPIIGYVPQKISSNRQGTPLSVLEFIAASLTDAPVCFGINNKIKQKVQEVLRITDAEHLASRRLADLSGGETQRVMLSFALALKPNILLLDEPISGVDQNGIAEFWNCINEIRLSEDIAVIIVSHDFGQVKKYATNVVLLNKTILKTAPPDEMFSCKEFKEVFHV